MQPVQLNYDNFNVKDVPYRDDLKFHMHKKNTAFETSILEANSLLKENRQQEAYTIIS